MGHCAVHLFHFPFRAGDGYFHRRTCRAVERIVFRQIEPFHIGGNRNGFADNGIKHHHYRAAARNDIGSHIRAVARIHNAHDQIQLLRTSALYGRIIGIHHDILCADLAQGGAAAGQAHCNDRLGLVYDIQPQRRVLARIIGEIHLDVIQRFAGVCINIHGYCQPYQHGQQKRNKSYKFAFFPKRLCFFFVHFQPHFLRREVSSSGGITVSCKR